MQVGDINLFFYEEEQHHAELNLMVGACCRFCSLAVPIVVRLLVPALACQG